MMAIPTQIQMIAIPSAQPISHMNPVKWTAPICQTGPTHQTNLVKWSDLLNLMARIPLTALVPLNMTHQDLKNRTTHPIPPVKGWIVHLIPPWERSILHLTQFWNLHQITVPKPQLTVHISVNWAWVTLKCGVIRTIWWKTATASWRLSPHNAVAVIGTWLCRKWTGWQ